MLATLLKKDLRRLRSNWIGFAILLAMPIGITALVGSVFGPSARSGEMPRIKLAIVNEDESLIGNTIVAMASGEQSQAYLDSKSVARSEAMDLINRNQISAVIVVPKDFTNQYVAGQSPPSMQLIKNPAQSYLPAITEELLRLLTEGLNAVSQNLAEEMPDVVEIIEAPGAPDTVKLASILTRIGDRLQRAEDYLFPPVIGYTRGTVAEAETSEEQSEGFNVFGLVMPGLAALFLLFTAEATARDLVVERRTKTLNRFRTYQVRLLPFFLAKAVYSFTVVGIAAAIILVGGAWIFGIHWRSPFETTILTCAYAAFCVGFAYLLVAVIYREKRIAILSTIIIMMMAFLGGSMLPTETLPPLIRESLSPWMPNHNFAESIKRLQFDYPGPHWATASMGLLAVGIVMLMIAITLFQYRLGQGAEE
ncbi:ABC-2 family transporter protein [Planctomycetes bacterium CA13]|uniref:ABC-2 family transporter protein n=1 Tax=Novipirellula herctigrandis TaxID=2527986 RepID=A0A5C5Z643_9BACT|nr:ABC-2 family transporter protein [Planctomycetes bacterium CA13]